MRTPPRFDSIGLAVGRSMIVAVSKIRYRVRGNDLCSNLDLRSVQIDLQHRDGS